MPSRSSFETKVIAAFGIAILVVVLLAAFTWKVSQDASEAGAWVRHTHVVLNTLSDIKAGTLQTEFATQNFRLTADPAALQERNASLAEREIAMQRVRTLTADNAQQQVRWARLKEVLDSRKAISNQIILLRQTQGQEAAQAYVAQTRLQGLRARTYELIDQMQAEERRLLEDRDDELRDTRETVTAAGVTVAVLLIVLLTATYIFIIRQMRETLASQRALAANEENLSTTLYSIGDAVLATDARGLVTRMNPVAERLTGWSFTDAQGKPVNEIFHIVDETTRQPVEVPVARALTTGQPQDLADNTSLISRDGKEWPIADSAAPIRDVRNEVQGVVLVFRDVSNDRRARRLIHEQNQLLEERVRQRTGELQESEDHLRSVINNVPALIAYVSAEQRYIYVNEKYRERFAPEVEDLTGYTVSEILGPERYAAAAPLITKVLEGHSPCYDWQPFPGVWQAICYVPRTSPQGDVVGYYVLGTDITQRKRDEEKIHRLNTDLEAHVEALEHVSRALRTLSAGNRTMLRATSEQELLHNMCDAIVTAGGYDLAVVWYCVSDSTRSLRAMAEKGYPEGLEALRQLRTTWGDSQHSRGIVATAIHTGQTTVEANMAQDPAYSPSLPPPNNYLSAIACPLRVQGKLIGALAIYDAAPNTFDTDEVRLLSESADDLAFGIATLRTRTEQRQTEEAMRRMTLYDGLTGLPNEAYFTEQLTAALEAGLRLDKPFAVLQANVDRLREINDALGFSRGDQMLREFSRRLRESAPESAVVARLRGDEFAVLLPDAGIGDALTLAESLERILAQPVPLADIPLDVSARIGIALFPLHGTTAHDLYRHMDIAVNQAKRKGVGHTVFNPALNGDHSRRLTFASELRRAIEGGDLLLYLQPKVEMASGRLCGAEALVRWKHTLRGIIPPGEFIDLAEQTGLIKPLTEWVIETSLQLNESWAKTGIPLPIAINLSARNLRDEDLVGRVRRAKATHGVTNGLLEMEITESTVMDDAQLALRVLHALREEGVPLYIDDFGTGYSSLSYLQKLPVEHIKIDQSFVRDMSSSKDSAVIVRSTIDLIHDLGRKAVAEGVETRENWDLLANLGCDIAQGYFIAKPMASEDFQAWMRGFQPPVASPL